MRVAIAIGLICCAPFQAAWQRSSVYASTPGHARGVLLTFEESADDNAGGEGDTENERKGDKTPGGNLFAGDGAAATAAPQSPAQSPVAVLPQGAPIIVDGRTLTGPFSLPQQRGGRSFLPVVSIARSLGDAISVDPTARIVEVRRQTGVVADFNAQLNQIRENGSVILVVSNTADIVFPPNPEQLMLPVEIVAALLDASILLDGTDAQAVRITRARTQVDTVRAGARRSSWELYQIDYDYNFNRYSGAFNQNLGLRSSGRIGDGRFNLTTNSSAGTGSGLGILRNGTFTYERPNGQRFIGGDFGTGTDLAFMSSSLRGGLAQIPAGGARVTAFAGRAISGVFPSQLTPLTTVDPLEPSLTQQRNSLSYDTNVAGGYVTFGPSASNPRRPGLLLFSSGLMHFNGPNRRGDIVTGSVRHTTDRSYFQADVGAGLFSGTQRDDARVDGFGLAADFSGSYNVTDDVTVQGRFTHIGTNFLSPQSGLNAPVNSLAGGLTWRAKPWLTATVSGSSANRPDAGGQTDRFVSTTLNLTPDNALPTIFFSHTQSTSTQAGSGAFTLLNATKEFSRWTLFANATRVSTRGSESLNSQLGANIRLADSSTLQVGQSFGSRGALGGTIDWQTPRLFSDRVSLSAGFGYNRSDSSPLATTERLTATMRLPWEQMLQFTYVHGQGGSQLLVNVRGPILRGRKSEAAAANGPISEIRSYGSFNGQVYQDINLNGRFDPGVDQAHSNATVRVDGNLYAVTDERGKFKIDNVKVGEHTIYLDLLSVRADLTILDSQLRTVELGPESDSIVDFRLVRTGRIAGLVWLDHNGNGKLEDGELPLIDVRIVTGSGRDTLTDSDGGFVIGDLPPGEHVVLVDEKTLPENTTVGTSGGAGSNVPAVVPTPEKRGAEQLDMRLRSFAVGVSGRLSLRPSASGGLARLNARGLPAPQALDTRAQTFVVWAVASGGRVVNLGELKREAGEETAAGLLEFAAPAALDQYSVIVTAEANVKASSPLGTLVLSTRGGEVAALFAEKETGPRVSSGGYAGINRSNVVSGSRQIRVRGGAETGNVNFPVITKPAEIKRFP